MQPIPSETVAQALAQALRRHGVETVFGQSLPSALILACEAIGIRQIAYRQENMGGAMADGFARVSGQISIVTAQNGPAATLLVPPLSEAMKASIPIVALVQDVERSQVDRNAFQDLDHFALFQSCTKWIRRLPSADRVDDYIDAAFVAAGSGRPGPAVLMLPADLLREAAGKPQFERRQSLGRWPLDRTRPADDSIQAAAQAIAEADAPIIMAGGGVLSSGGKQVLEELQELASLPVFTTNMGKGAVNEHHPLSCGPLGGLVGPKSLGSHMRGLADEADLVILVGTRTNQNGTDSWRLIPNAARVIHIDIDPAEIGRTYEALRLVGDAAETLTALVAACRVTDMAKRQAARGAVEQRIAAAWAAFEGDRKDRIDGSLTPIRPEQVVVAMQKAAGDEAVFVADASYSSMWLVGQLKIGSKGPRVVTPRGLAGLGWGLPLAMGAKVAKPDQPVFAMVGDGGFAHSWAELETMVRSRLKVVVVVLNNGILGFQKDAETVKFGEYTTACHFAPVDHAALARACGCGGETVSDPGEVAAAVGRALDADGPYLIEIITDPGAHPPLSLFAGVLSD